MSRFPRLPRDALKPWPSEGRYPASRGITTGRIVRRRRRAARRWAKLRREAHLSDRLIEPKLPRYFIDRYAFRELPLHGSWRQPPQLYAPPITDRATFLAAAATPAHRLGGWVPEPEEMTGTSALYRSLRQRWAAFCKRIELPAAVGDLPDARSLTWRQVMDDSVFYPGPPVFRGATFIDALSETAASDLLTRVGPEGVVDFYCFMLQVHETVHRHQTGEPLLNELVQAALWSKFLSEESLWSFQHDTCGSLVREAAVVAQFPMVVGAAVAARLDTAKMIASIAAENAYFACCLLALAVAL